MEFHYIVIYNSDTKKWYVSGDMDGYFPDGNVWAPELDAAGEYGWLWPDDETTPEIAAIDERAYTMLNTLASIWPEVYDGD